MLRAHGLVKPELARECSEFGLSADERPFCMIDEPDWRSLSPAQVQLYRQRLSAIRNDPSVRLIESPVYKRLWRGRQGIFGRYDKTFGEKTATALKLWLAERVEAARTWAHVHARAARRGPAGRRAVLAVCEVLTGRRDFSLSQLVADALRATPCRAIASTSTSPPGS